MLTPNEAYQYDGTFRRVVDLMAAYLSEFEITPAELRQAAMLASSMHEARRIKPLFISKSKSWLYGGIDYPVLYMDEAKDIPPAMFGGMNFNIEQGTISGRWTAVSLTLPTNPIASAEQKALTTNTARPVSTTTGNPRD